jgi:hypothetical protein
MLALAIGFTGLALLDPHARHCFGGYSGGVTPGPIPNPEVKPSRADGTAWEAGWESRSSPELLGRKVAFGRPFVVCGPDPRSGWLGPDTLWSWPPPSPTRSNLKSRARQEPAVVPAGAARADRERRAPRKDVDRSPHPGAGPVARAAIENRRDPRHRLLRRSRERRRVAGSSYQGK